MSVVLLKSEPSDRRAAMQREGRNILKHGLQWHRADAERQYRFAMRMHHTVHALVLLVNLAMDIPLHIPFLPFLLHDRIGIGHAILLEILATRDECRRQAAREKEGARVLWIAHGDVAKGIHDGVVVQDVVGCDQRAEQGLVRHLVHLDFSPRSVSRCRLLGIQDELMHRSHSKEGVGGAEGTPPHHSASCLDLWSIPPPCPPPGPRRGNGRRPTTDLATPKLPPDRDDPQAESLSPDHSWKHQKSYDASNSTTMPTTEIAIFPLTAGSDISDPANAAAVAMKASLSVVARQPGCRQVLFGMQIENPANVELAVSKSLLLLLLRRPYSLGPGDLLSMNLPFPAHRLAAKRTTAIS
nr:hypothetical protein CFP56_65516 [Quercus suber]